MALCAHLLGRNLLSAISQEVATLSSQLSTMSAPPATSWCARETATHLGIPLRPAVRPGQTSPVQNHLTASPHRTGQVNIESHSVVRFRRVRRSCMLRTARLRP